MKQRSVLRIFASALALCLSGVAYAGNCTAVTSTGVSFPTYFLLDATPTTGTGTISVTCNGKGSFTIALSTGSSGSYSTRYMSGGSPVSQLDYNLFTNAAHSILWGDGTAGTSTVSASYNGQTITETVYGEIPSGQSVSTGSYTDSITATVTY